MMEIVVTFFCVVLAGLAVFQVALVCGAPWGNFAWGGQHRVLPLRLRVGSVISIVIYAIFAVIALDRAEVIGVFPWAGFSVVAMWVIAAYLVLGTVLNGFSRSAPERRTMTPVAAVLALFAVILAVS